MKILQQGNTMSEKQLINISDLWKIFGFNQAEEQIEEDIKQKLFDAF